MRRGQDGFTLVEIAVVLVIVGLLLGGILKGRELINSARVRSLADTASSIQAAYFGFIDRFHRVPGDWNAADATTAIGVTINSGGNDNGRLDNPAGDYTENNALWEQLSKSGFLQGSYRGGSDAPTPDGEVSPLNAFHHVIVLGRTSDYLGDNPVRLNLVMGRGVPVGIMRELDIKLDDGAPIPERCVAHRQVRRCSPLPAPIPPTVRWMPPVCPERPRFGTSAPARETAMAFISFRRERSVAKNGKGAPRDAPRESACGFRAARPAIRFENVSKRFGTQRGLERVSFEVGSGESLALVGMNGAGKSTCIKGLLDLSEPDSGVIEIFGTPCTEPGRGPGSPSCRNVSRSRGT